MNVKKKVLVTIAIVLVCGLAYFYWPLPFDDSFDYISIGYVEYGDIGVNGEPIDYAGGFSFSSQDAELQQIKDTLKKYTIHRVLTLPFSDVVIHWEGPSKNFHLALSNGNYISLSKSPYILYDSQVYRVGYWSNSKAIALIDELRSVLAIE